MQTCPIAVDVSVELLHIKDGFHEDWSVLCIKEKEDKDQNKLSFHTWYLLLKDSES